MKKKVDIAVLTLTLNSEAFLNESLKNTQKAIKFIQKKIPEINLQHYIVDGGSNDSTLEIISRYEKVNLIKSKVKGLYKTIDSTLLDIKSKFIIYVHSDDYVSINFIYELYKTFKFNSGQIPVAKVNFIDTNSNVLYSRKFPKLIKRFQYHENLILHPNCLYPSILEKSFPYSYDVVQKESNNLDWFHINKLINLGLKFIGCNEAIYYYRIHSKTITSRTIKNIENNQKSIISIISKIYLLFHETKIISRLIFWIFGRRRFR